MWKHIKFDQWIAFRLANVSMMLTGIALLGVLAALMSLVTGRRAREVTRRKARMIRMGEAGHTNRYR